MSLLSRDPRLSLFLLLVLSLTSIAAGCSPSPATVADATTSQLISIDSFTDIPGTDLRNHVGELNASWSFHPNYSAGLSITSDGKVFNGTNTKVYYASATPSTSEYTVEADLKTLTNQDHGGILGRINPESDTYYSADGSSGLGTWQLRKRVNGSWTLLDYTKNVSFESGRTYHLKLELGDGSQRFFVDGVLVLDSSDDDPALRAAGRAGLRLSSDTYHAGDETKGWQLDNFQVSESGSGDTIPPDAPTNLSADLSADDTTIQLNWDDNSESDLVGYNVYRSDELNGSYTKINGSVVSGSFFEDTSAPSGIEQYYQVTAVDTSGNVSSPSNTASAIRPDDSTAPAIPIGLTAVGNVNAIELAWNANSEQDIAGYNIYRSEQSSSGYINLNSSLITTTTFNDASASVGLEYFYVATAVDTSGNESQPSNEASAVRADAGFHLLVSEASNRSNPNTLDGSTVDDTIYVFVLPEASAINQVRFYLDNPGMTGSPRQIENNPPYDFAGGTVNTASAFNTSSIADGAHTITALISLSGSPSVVLHATFNVANDVTPPIDTTAPDAPVNLTASLSTDELTIDLDWDDNSEPDLAGYNIYRSNQPAGPFTKLNSSLLATSSYSDVSAPAGASYYQVTAVDSSSNASIPSATASATRPDDTTPPAAPTGLTASASLAGINLAWTANAEPDLAGYSVYRSNQSSGPFTKLNGALLTSSSYTDASLSPGQTAFYQVTASDSSSNESAPSNTVNASQPDAAFAILFSTTSNRANPIPLDGQTVNGNLYIFTAPDDPAINQVRFFIDDPAMASAPRSIESNPPYDLAGGTASMASAFNSASLADGNHTITAALSLADGSTAVIHAAFTVANALPTNATPLPGILQAEDYDLGGEGVGYHDTTTGNTGGAYRTDRVDIQPTNDTGGGFNVGWVRAGEWLRYTVEIATAGDYNVTIRVATPMAGRQVHLTLDGADISGPVTLPNTGDWQVWGNATLTVTLPAGVHTLTLFADTDSFNLNYLSIS